jgi:hypothetical protein
MRTVAHIINPVIVGRESDLFVAQPITFETIRLSREFAQGQVDVDLRSAQYYEDRPLVPSGFQKTPDLDRSVLDFGTFQVKRKLPLLKDILDRLYGATEAEYLIYTNVDIALMPHFYIAVDRLITLGYDAFIISRRVIPKTYTHPHDIPLMAAQVGEPHVGHDCFVFKRSVYSDYFLGNVCIGAARVDEVLALNLIYHAQKFERFSDLHLTFHIGNDRVWKSASQADYFVYNESELDRVLKHYDVLQNPLDHPVVDRLLELYGRRSFRQRVFRKCRRITSKTARVIACVRS